MADTHHPATAPKKGGGFDLQRKIGPLPLWAWVAIVGVSVGAIIIIRRRSSSTAATTAGSSTSNLNAVDPNNPLGLTYAEENADIAAGIDPNTGVPLSSENSGEGLYGTSGADDGGGGDSSGSDGTGNYLTDASITQDFENALQQYGATQPGATTPSSGGATTPATTTLQVPAAVTSAITDAQKTANQALNAPALAAGAIRAPFGAKKPTAPAGYTTVGEGHGYWEFVPNKVTNTKPPASVAKGVKAVGAGAVDATKSSKTVSGKKN